MFKHLTVNGWESPLSPFLHSLALVGGCLDHPGNGVHECTQYSAKPHPELKDNLQFHTGSSSTISFGMAHRAAVALYNPFLAKREFERVAVKRQQKIIIKPPLFCMITNVTDSRGLK